MCMHNKLLQSSPTLWDPMDCSLPGFSVHGILQARVLEWIAIPSSRGSSQPRNQTCIPYISRTGRQVLYHESHMGSPQKNIGKLWGSVWKWLRGGWINSRGVDTQVKARQAYGKGRVAMMRPHAWVQILNVTESKHLDTKMRKKALQGQAATVSTFPLINGGLYWWRNCECKHL